MTYPVDPSALKASFSASGSITLIAPVVGQLVITGHIMNSSRPPPAGIDPARLPGPEFADSVSIEGIVNGDPASRARIHLGLWGAYGRAALDGFAYDFDPFFENGTTTQRAVQTPFARDTSPWWDEMSAAVACSSPADVVLWIEESARIRHQDWASRSTSAFDQQVPLWCGAGLQVSLTSNMRMNVDLAPFTTICDNDAVPQFRAWLDREDQAGTTIEANLLWTHRDLTSDKGNAYGCASARSPDREYASGVIEMTEQPSDTYDANNAFQRGTVLGHELTHVFGEGDHRNSCRSFVPAQCNVMQSLTPFHSWRTMYWTEQTRCEVETYYRFLGDCPG